MALIIGVAAVMIAASGVKLGMGMGDVVTVAVGDAVSVCARAVATAVARRK